MTPLETGRSAEDYESAPCFGELIAIIVAGGFHIVADVTVSAIAARVFNIFVAAAFMGYVIWRARNTRNISRVWGLRFTNFWPAIKLQLVFALPAMAVLVGYGMYIKTFPPPGTFWLVVFLYPIWGIAQQFALQNFLVKNLRTVVASPVLRSLVAASLFGLAHFPLIPIVALTLVSGFFITWLYDVRPNVWAAGCVHGVLGATAFYLVLDRDPVARTWQLIAQ